MATKRNKGESYCSRDGSVRLARNVLKEPCPSTCRFGCTVQITDDERDLISKEFWSLPDLKAKRAYIIRHMEKIVPKCNRRRTNSPTRRALNCTCYFDVNDIKVYVCRLYFLNTLNVSTKMIRIAVQKLESASSQTDLPDSK